MWRHQLGKFIETGGYRTQGELVDKLSKCGFEVNQATVSRELKARAVVKTNGYYAFPRVQLPSGVDILDAQVAPAGQTIVLKTHVAGAPLLAQAIDDANLPGVLGTIAGNDHVFVAVAGRNAAEALARWVGEQLSEIVDLSNE